MPCLTPCLSSGAPGALSAAPTWHAEHVPGAGVPCELVRHWSPMQPLLVGGLAPAEEARTFLQLRLKRHRWSPKVLKARDPLTFSIGWRRFQSLPLYAMEDANGRLRWATLPWPVLMLVLAPPFSMPGPCTHACQIQRCHIAP